MAYVGPQPTNVTDIVGWQPNPLTRGTADILTSCLITLSLSIWSALHLNVAGDDGWYARLWAKIGWLLLSLIAPEVVAAVALAQRNQAKKLADRMNRELGLPPPPGIFTRFVSNARSKYQALKGMMSKSTTGQTSAHELDEEMGTNGPNSPTDDTLPPSGRIHKHSWTLKHGFFANMGGFGLYIPPLPDDVRFLPNKSDEARFMITPEGMEFLAKFPEAHKDIPNLSAKEIDALSRASGFAKFVVCCQAAWFIGQAVLRLMHHMPISLLELNTLAHAICVLLTYAFWWNKPFDVEQPIYLSSAFLHPAAANFRIHTTTSSIGRLWREQAFSFLSDQETHYTFRLNLRPDSVWTSWFPERYITLKDCLFELNCDAQALQLQSETTIEADPDAFTRFCIQQNRTTTRSAKIRLSWAEPIPRTSICLRPTVPISSLYKLGHNNFGLRVIAVVALIPWLVTEALGAIIPQVRRHFRTKAQGTIVDAAKSLKLNVLNLPWIVKEPREENGTSPPSDIADFVANSGGNQHINTCDANLVEAAWQHLQIGASTLISPTRLSEASVVKFSGDIRQDWKVLTPFLFYTAVYGGIHFMGLEATFRNDTMKRLWKLSSVAVASGVAIAILVVYPWWWLFQQYRAVALTRQRNAFVTTRPLLLRSVLFTELLLVIILFFFPIGLIIGYAIIAYVGARSFLFVESFIALTHQPRAVYEVRPWAAYWPHIS